MPPLTDKVAVTKLPLGRDLPGEKRWEEERGEFAQIAYQEEIRHLAFLEIRKGFTRGKHYHEKKEEVFYVIRGKLKGRFVDMDTAQEFEEFFERGDKIRIKPRCGHLFYGLEDTLVVEYSPQVYEDGDNYKMDW
jgi:dTDP-4-dehydrorhamnose 3,5-epimerase-like enzyme